uniref:Scaffolding anchor of CK1 domain-containing protein n=1 Tax=Paramormyrops kingsleyae TaxID=1676925 RepID=A0A3B3QEF1_9TELE|nr:protein FAM83H-like [Paramormyrops kingsleyae]XP_023681552.1 protein FAM83H-like [Paramormyrops kingsleyae]
MAHRSQRSSLEDNPFAPNYLPPHYREEYRLAIDALVEHDLEGYYSFLQRAGVVDFLSQLEVERIRNTVQAPRQISQPELLYLESEPDGSSDTYWPVHSDMEAPCLDLGWPMNQGFIGPTEVTTLVNPSDPEMPSIKEQVRRLIRGAQQVIAVVMDMFTDVDIFADLLAAAARRVVVYILLDEQNAHYFSTMVTNCRVNLEMVQSMRVRTVSGSTYFCCTGKSFKGQMMDRFLMVDCKAVLSGNYSFMWTFEKIHRCIAHLFLGELVITFDEEFRILYAQSEPLVIENSLVPVPVPEKSNYGVRQFMNPNPMQMRNSREFLHIESPHFSELLGCPLEDHMEMEHNMPLLRRKDHFRGFQDPETQQVYSNKYSSQQLRMERSFMGYDRSVMAARQMEMNTYKRHCYAEGNQESYSSSRQIMKRRIRYQPEDVESLNSYQREQHYRQSGGSGLGHGMYNKLQTHEHPYADQYSEQYEYQPELEPPDGYNRVLDYVSSDSSREIRHSYEPKPTLVEGHCGQSSTKRPSLGQPYPCQSSPVQSHPPDHKQLFVKSNQDHQPRDPSVKQGLRKWRISSYLSALEDATDEGMPEPLGPDAFDEPVHQSEEESYGLDAEHSKFSARDRPQIPTIRPNLLPRFGKPVLKGSENQPYYGADSQRTTETAEVASDSDSGSASITGGDKAEEVELRKPGEIIRHESFRNRANLSVLRSSRLRSSLIFSSSQLEQHFSTEMKSATELKHNENPVEEKETDPLKTSTVVAEILGKRRFMPREPYDWSIHKQRTVQNASSTSINKTDECTNISVEKMNLYKASSETSLKFIEMPDCTNISENKDISMDPGQDNQANVGPQEKTEITAGETSRPLHGLTSFINMNDPEARLKYFKELAAKRKSSKTENKCEAKNPEPPVKNTDLSQTLFKNSSTTHVGSGTTSVSKEHKIPMDSANGHTTEQHKTVLEEPAKTTEGSHKVAESTISFINMNDPETRFKYFKELAAKRKVSKTENKSETKNPEPPVRNTDLSQIATKNSSTTHVGSGTTSVSKEHRIPMDSANEHTTEQHKTVLEEPAKTTEGSHKVSESTTSFINMNDPETRFKYFKELAAKRKVSKTENRFEPKNPEPPVRNIDQSQTLTYNSLTTHVESGTTSHSEEHIKLMDSVNEHSKEKRKIVQEEPAKMTEGFMNMNDPETRFLYFKELAAKRKASKIASESVAKPSLNTTDPSEASADSLGIKPEISVTGSKPNVSISEVSQSQAVVPLVPEPLTLDHLEQDIKNASQQELNRIAEMVKKEPAVKQQPSVLDEQDTLRAFMSTSTTASALSCNEELLRDATDTQKTQLMKSRHHNASNIFFCEPSKALDKSQGSGSSPDTVPLTGDSKQDFEVHDHLDSQVQKVKGREGDAKPVTENVTTVITGTEKSEQLASEAEHVSMPESSVDVPGTAQSKGEDVNQSAHVLTSSRNSQSRYQAATTSILYSSNLRDDTKVILERISANSQSRMELAKQAAPITDDAKEGENAHGADKAPESVAAGQSTSHVQHNRANPQDREVLLKRMESMRKEKKVYSRFEMGS